MEGWVDGRWEEGRGLARCGYGSLSSSLALADRQTARQPDRCGWCLMLAFASCCAPVPVPSSAPATGYQHPTSTITSTTTRQRPLAQPWDCCFKLGRPGTRQCLVNRMAARANPVTLMLNCGVSRAHAQKRRRFDAACLCTGVSSQNCQPAPAGVPCAFARR